MFSSVRQRIQEAQCYGQLGELKDWSQKLLNTSHLIQGGLKKYKRQIVFISSQSIDKFLKLLDFTLSWILS